MNIPLQSKLDKDLKSLSARYAGLYLVNKFFIKIITGKLRSDIPSYNFKKHTFSDEDQIKLQMENYPTLYHEYIHYVHEVSTMAGIAQFHFSVLKRSIFSHFVEKDRPSIAIRISGVLKDKFDILENTLNVITGGFSSEMEDRVFDQIDDILFMQFPCYDPASDSTHMKDIPIVIYTYYDKKTGKAEKDSVAFGKLFLYEGLAHSLDQITSIQGGLAPTPISKIAPEYRMLDMVAQKLFPDIDKRSLLEIASMSLAWFNCGERFIKALMEAAKVPHLPGYVFEIQNELHLHMTTHRNSIKKMLAHIKDVFKYRRELHIAAGHLCKIMLNSYDQRIQRPLFEIEVTFNRQQHKLREYVDLCQMVYVFADDDEVFMRDFAGSYLPKRLRSRLLTFMCHVDYAQIPIGSTNNHCCPLYTFCPHKRRIEKAEQCRTNPRLAFDDQPQYGWCEYGLGVAYMTGEDKPKKQSSVVK